MVDAQADVPVKDDFEERRQLATEGRVVIRGKDLPFKHTPQGSSRRYLFHGLDTALQDWRVFLKDVRQGVGKHRHQGGLVIYIVRGRGYSVFDGVKLEWKQGDLLSLPVKPDGVEHQHFAYPGDEPAQWVAFVYVPFHYAMGAMLEQIENREGWTSTSATENKEG